ncbi:MAG: hypothetical protein KGL39_43720 [Patescibacteria group bacterium]|nr:hypothetical protein [Patescibacteria group bacterium]
MDISEVERETAERQERAGEIFDEFDFHYGDVIRLEAAIDSLRESREKVDSAGVQEALRAADEARDAIHARVSELRKECKSLLERNRRMRKRCEVALVRKSQALQGVEQMGGVPDSLKASYGRIRESLSADIARTRAVYDTLEDVEHQLDLTGQVLDGFGTDSVDAFMNMVAGLRNWS